MPLKLSKHFFSLGLFVKDERVLLHEDFPDDHNNFDCCYGTMVTVNYQQIELFLPSPFYLCHQKEDCNFFLLLTLPTQRTQCIKINSEYAW